MPNNSVFAEVLLFQKVGENKDTLTYAVPEGMDVSPGLIVEIPLRNRKTKGVIYKISNNKPPYKCKDILHIVENAPHLCEWQIELMDWISEYYFCPLFRALKLFIPAALVKKKKIATWKPPTDTEFKLKFKHKLNAEQTNVIDQYQNSKKKVSLLHGITGSGKTEIYLHTVEEALKKGKQVLMLIPEISLSPQMQRRFQDHFHEKTSLIHSQLTQKQKEEAWLSIHKGETKIIIGSRSALFAPFQDLGCIIMDEEHDHSYKQDQAPRYHAITVAKKMTDILDIKLLMGSATPSLESYYHAENGDYEHLSLTERPNKKSSLPKTKVVDLREEFKKKNYSIFSEILQAKIHQKLENKEQSILFLNRRGTASAVICRVCGYVEKCESCDIAMTYHKKFTVEDGTHDAERLICHHCGKIKKVPKECPNCHSSYIKYIGLGTQRVESELQKLYPQAKIMRADRDTTRKRDQFKHIYETFRSGEADILVGTQMIAIGLHLPKVNLVGVVLADTSLTLPNFRSSEQTFQLLTQVSGRAGRSDQPGDAIIQTYLPNHYAIQSAAKHDYHEFYETEIKIREELGYPPFKKLLKITLKDKNNKKCLDNTLKLFHELENLNKDEKTTINYYPALIPKLKDIYRWHILIAGPNPSALIQEVDKNQISGIVVDVDPTSTI